MWSPVAGVHQVAQAARAVLQHGFGEVLARDVDVFAAFQVPDAAALHRAPHRLADLLLVTAQKALAIADRLVLACGPTVDDLLQGHHLTSPRPLHARVFTISWIS